MEILYNYKPYDLPKTGEFWTETNEYRLPGGWVKKLETLTIIGEDDTAFVYRLKETGHGEWIDGQVVQLQYILPIGIHKSRLHRWLDTQLSLF